MRLNHFLTSFDHHRNIFDDMCCAGGPYYTVRGECIEIRLDHIFIGTSLDQMYHQSNPQRKRC